MGLSLSPIIFVLYVHFVLKEVTKDKIIMYIDDMGIVMDIKLSPEENLDFVLDIINKLETYGLIINRKKTVIITGGDAIRIVFKEIFPTSNKEKYLGRQLCLNGDGVIVNDDRFYNLKGMRSNAIPYWTSFFIKRLVSLTALVAKLRCILMVWSTDDIMVRTAIWRQQWTNFKKGMGIYSYTQLTFACFNLFRYFFDDNDLIDVITLSTHANDGIVVSEIVRNKLKVHAKSEDLEPGLYQINVAIDNLRINTDIGFKVEEDPFHAVGIFLNNLWKQFKKNILNLYLEKKKGLGIATFPNIWKFCNNKFFNHSGILQRIAFCHYSVNKKYRKKQLFEILALENLRNEVNKALRSKKDLNEELIYIYPKDNVISEIDAFNEKQFENWCGRKYQEYWPLLNDILLIFKKENLSLIKQKKWKRT